MFRTESQRKASRENGAKSHGPATPEGKDRSSQNATKHGLFSDSVLLQPENRAAWNQLANDLVARFHPADNVELAIIHDMAVTQWRKERAQNMEAAILDMEYQIIDMTETEAKVLGDEIRRVALAWSNAVGKQGARRSLEAVHPPGQLLDAPPQEAERATIGPKSVRSREDYGASTSAGARESEIEKRTRRSRDQLLPSEYRSGHGPNPRNEPGAGAENRSRGAMYWQVALLE